MTHHPKATAPLALHDEGTVALQIGIAPADAERFEQLAARTGRTAQQALEDFVTKNLGHLILGIDR